MTTAGLVPKNAAKRLGSHDGALEYFVCVNGHLHGTCWLAPLSSDEDANDDDEYEMDGSDGTANTSGGGLTDEYYDDPRTQIATKGNLGEVVTTCERGLGFKPRRGGFPSGAKKEWGLSPKAKVRVLYTAQLNVTVSCIIEKLLLFWKDFKHTLKHLKEELTLVELGSHLRIEESLMMHDNDKPKRNNVAGPLVVNMVEHNNSS
nr:EID1-like F-box protein 3 [Tanacetum cinerariifolium]